MGKDFYTDKCVGCFYFALATLVAKFLQLKVLKDLAVVAKLTKVSKIRVVENNVPVHVNNKIVKPIAPL